MKLGKALATGVAEEQLQPRVAEEDIERPEEIQEEPQAAAPEEVPAAR